VKVRSEQENWSVNARLIATAVDSVNVGSGAQWNYKLKRRADQCKGHKPTLLRNTFNMMTDKLRTAAIDKNTTVCSIMDN
jgi:hypothetical protein